MDATTATTATTATLDALRAVRTHIRNRRDALTGSAIDDSYARLTVHLLDRIAVSSDSNRRTVTASLADTTPAVRREHHAFARNVLTAALDAAPGTVRQTDDLTYTLTV